MKEFSQIVLGNEFFLSIKGHLCLTKWYLANPEGIRITLIGSCFWYYSFKLRKKIQKVISSTNRPISGHFIFLKQSLIDKRFAIPVCFIISNSDSNQFEFIYLAKLLSTFKVRPRLDPFYSQLSDKKVPGWRWVLMSTFIDNPIFRFKF